MGLIEKRSLSDQFMDILKARILSGEELPPGTRLRVDAWAEELGISRTPVREGLQKLVTRGLVAYDGNLYMVREYNRKDVEDIYDIRLSLEVLAAQRAAEHINDRTLDELRNICKEVDRYKETGDMKEYESLDLRFHDLIAEGTSNARLKELLSSIREQVWFIRHWVHDCPDKVNFIETETLKEHRAILECLRSRDGEGAGLRMKEHLEKGKQRTLEAFKG